MSKEVIYKNTNDIDDLIRTGKYNVNYSFANIRRRTHHIPIDDILYQISSPDFTIDILHKMLTLSNDEHIFVVGMLCGGIMEDPKFHFDKPFDIIVANDEKSAKDEYNKKHNCSFYYGSVVFEITSIDITANDDVYSVVPTQYGVTCASTTRCLNERYLERMKALEDIDDKEMAHSEADSILCELLNELGYHEIVEAFGRVGKYYA